MMKTNFRNDLRQAADANSYEEIWHFDMMVILRRHYSANIKIVEQWL